MIRPAILVLACVLSACAASPSAPPRRPHPPGAATTYLNVPHAFFLRVDCAAIRTTPLADEVAALWRDSPLFQRLASDPSFDPIRDLDVMVTTTASVASWHGGPAADRWRVVIRHHRDATGARAMLGSMANARGDVLVWREGQGLPSAVLPGEISRGTPHAIVLTATDEAVIAPDDELGAILAVARDQAARRDADTDVIEPGLTTPPGELVRAETTSPPPVLASMGAAGARASVMRAGQGAAVHLELDFGTASDAQSAADRARMMMPMLAENPLVTTLGLAHPFAIAQVSIAGATVTLDTRATFEELSAALRALAMVSSGGL